MIFVTVGTDVPFDRLVRAVDDWAAATGRTNVFAQIGNSALKPQCLRWRQFLEPDDFQQAVMSASAIVGHAGMGTILTALRYGKPLIVMPRRASLGEHRNEHQLATASRLKDIGKVSVAIDEFELRMKLQEIDQLSPDATLGAYAQPELLQAIREFIHK